MTTYKPPVKPPLELQKYFFPYVLVTADAEYDPSAGEVQPHFNVRTTVERNLEDNVYQVVLEIIAEPEDESAKIPYAIHVVVVGLFTVDKSFPEQEKLLRVTGASMLYSAAREFIITITSRGPWSQVIIPTVSFPSQEKEEGTQTENRERT